MYGNIIVTDAGIQEVINAERTGTAPVVLTEVGFGTGQYTPTTDQTALHDEFKRLPANALSGGNVGDNVIYINARDTSGDAYTLFEFGVYTQSGTLFAVCSQNVPILQKAAGAQAYLDIEFLLTNVNPASVTLGDTNFFNPPATTETEGVVELATAAETEAGASADKAVTPAGLLARTATTERTGLVELATAAETEAGASADKAVTPAGLLARTATTERTGLVKIGNTMTVANDGTIDVKSAVERMTIIDKIVNEDGTNITVSKTVTINDSSSWVTLGKLNITPSNKECILDFTFMLEFYYSFDSQNLKSEYELLFGVFVGNTEVYRYSLMPSTDDYRSSPSFRCTFTANINNTIYIKVKRSDSSEPHSATFLFPKVYGFIM